MAMATSCCCCRRASSPGLPLRQLLTATGSRSSSSLRLRLRLLITRSRSPRDRRSRGICCLSSRTPEPPPLDVTTDDELSEEECSSDRDDERSEEEECSSDRDERIGFEIQVTKATGKRNRRVVRARVGVEAPLEAVWATLTDYEGLADFIPGLSECRLVDQQQGFARLYQVGQQDLALGFKFNAKGTIDCYEREMMEESLPDARTRRREIHFNMVQGDFKLFQGKWSVQQVVHAPSVDQQQEFQTTLSYLVELEPKLWVPVSLLEGRISSEIKNNLVSIREQAQRIHTLQL